ncbi:MAG: GDP-mannose 4,6-dehydratase [Dehalococcoidia bacterium]|nr:GDP-mannose 4,6-dehydratase [Dehalococcoidia bacterium]
MRILITGVRGFVGRHLATYCLQDARNEVWGLDRPRESVVGPPLPASVRLCTADITDRPSIIAAVQEAQPDAVYHLAGRSNPASALADPSGILKTNIYGQLHLLQGVVAAGNQARVLVVGSSKEYGSGPPGEQRTDEAVALAPVDLYGVSKVAQDMLGHHFSVSEQCHVVRVRPFNHIGPGQPDSFVASAFARQLAEIKLSQREPWVEVGNLTPVVDFTDVRDMVRAYVLALECGEPGAVYNIGSGQGVQIRVLLDMLIEASGLASQVSVHPDPARQQPGNATLIVCDASRFRTVTGWQPRYSLAETLRDLYHYWLDRLESGPVPDQPLC